MLIPIICLLFCCSMNRKRDQSSGTTPNTDTVVDVMPPRIEAFEITRNNAVQEPSASSSSSLSLWGRQLANRSKSSSHHTSDLSVVWTQSRVAMVSRDEWVGPTHAHKKIFATGCRYEGSFYDGKTVRTIDPFSLNFGSHAVVEDVDSTGSYEIRALCQGNRLALTKTYTDDARRGTFEMRLQYSKLDKSTILVLDLSACLTSSHANSGSSSGEGRCENSGHDELKRMEIPCSFLRDSTFGFIGRYQMIMGNSVAEEGVVVLYPVTPSTSPSCPVRVTHFHHSTTDGMEEEVAIVIASSSQ